MNPMLTYTNEVGGFKRGTGLLVIEVRNSNPNGDPDRDSDPRQRPDQKGEISPVSYKRKLRDLVEWKGEVWDALAGDLNLTAARFGILESRAATDRPLPNNSPVTARRSRTRTGTGVSSGTLSSKA